MTDTPPAAPPADAPPADAPPADAPPASPEWLATLPDDLKGDATLSRYKDIEALARGHVETKKLVGSKLSLPGEGAGEDEWGAFYNAIGRPESADKYEIKTIELPVDAPEETRTALAEATKPFRELAHKLGLTGAQATALSEFELQRQSEFFTKGQQEVDALKASLGRDYEPKLAAAQQIFQQLFGNGADAAALTHELDRKVGSGALLKGMMRLAEVAGEARIVDTDSIEGFGSVGDAQAKITELQGDKTWRDKFKAGDATVLAQHRNLLALAARQAQRRQPSA